MSSTFLILFDMKPQTRLKIPDVTKVMPSGPSEQSLKFWCSDQDHIRVGPHSEMLPPPRHSL